MHGGYTYNDFSHPFGQFDQRNPGFTNKGPGWVVFGLRHLESGVMGAKPGIELDLVGPDGQEPPSWLVLANTIAELATKMGVDPDTLEDTVARYNRHAEKGEDPDFGDPTQTHVLTGPDTVNLRTGHRSAVRRDPAMAGHRRHQRRAAHRRRRSRAGQPHPGHRGAVRRRQHHGLGTRPHLPRRRILRRPQRRHGIPRRSPRSRTTTPQHRRIPTRQEQQS